MYSFTSCQIANQAMIVFACVCVYYSLALRILSQHNRTQCMIWSHKRSGYGKLPNVIIYQSSFIEKLLCSAYPIVTAIHSHCHTFRLFWYLDFFLIWEKNNDCSLRRSQSSIWFDRFFRFHFKNVKWNIESIERQSIFFPNDDKGDVHKLNWKKFWISYIKTIYT